MYTEVKLTRHTSANLEEINEKIAQLLKDPSEALDNSPIDVDAMSLADLKAFAERGGLGACVSKVDILASTPEELMYLQGERITILKHVENDIYMGYCEGVIGNFNAENVHFVELDPRVLESLDADLDFTDHSQYRNSASSHGTDIDIEMMKNRQDHFNQMRDSIHSFSSNSDRYASPVPSSRHWVNKPSFESINSVSTTSSRNLKASRTSYDSYNYSGENLDTEHDPFDTSALNVDYSDEENSEVYKMVPPPKSTARPVSAARPASTARPTPPPVSSTVKSNVPKISPSPIQNENIDDYGFVIVPGRPTFRANKSAKAMKEYRENELKWLNIVNKLDAGTVKKDVKMKKLVRGGIPGSVRAKVWQFLAGSNDYQKPNYFQKLLSKPKLDINDVIERDIERCYPDHTQFMEKDGQGQQNLRNILQAYAQYNTELGYCQGMGRLAGLMLMQMTVEESFWLLVATIDRYMNGYFTPTLSQLRIDAYIIGQLLKDHNPKLAQHLESNDVLPIMYIGQWFLTAFTMTLPWESVLRVWDAFYFEGIKVFYRVSLAILDLCKDHLLQSCPTNSELLGFLLHIPHNYLEPNNLLDTAFRINLSKTNIKRYAKKAATEDATTSGLSFEDVIKNLQVGNPGHSSGFKGLGGRIAKKASMKNMRDNSDA
ncbi:hypothetical protein G6F56_005577 [Rhizopus delemar]|uniref:Rab-GAP TBC domain-containing protein n=1 Tax=Rhizopus stolonifer TaxID=4846 RepID=A0A367KGW3_RHIST|nr:hypothetical protein G6F56_005577 [Rhizopus delemar]RCI01465.1 hypothetical protein CU098_010173 [Rhizopus stolonifer]